MGIFAPVRWKFLLAVFKIRRLINEWFSTRELDYPRKKLLIFTGNIREFETRAKSCAKEPETINWIERFSDLEVFYDIGANVGAYSLVAGVNNKKVFAFEPAFQNFSRLNENVSLNHLDGRITCFPIALSTQTKLGSFKYIETTPGSSKGFYNEEAKFHLDGGLVAEKTMLIYSLDDFIQKFALPVPNMLKIDVDGGEMDVIQGASKVLSNTLLKSILIEIDGSLNNTSKIIEQIENAGLKLEAKFNRIKDINNYIFVRG